MEFKMEKRFFKCPFCSHHTFVQVETTLTKRGTMCTCTECNTVMAITGNGDIYSAFDAVWDSYEAPIIGKIDPLY